MKKRKRGLLIILLSLIISIIIFNRYEIINRIREKANKQEPIQDITFNVYSNENDILKVMIIAEDSENGIDKLLYKAKDGKQKEVIGQGKNKIAIDYIINEDGNYEFKAINKLGQEIIKTLTVDETYRKSLIDIQVNTETEISTNGKVNIDYHGNENKNRMYKIGENGTWTNYDGQFAINSYEIIKKNLQNNETKTVTLYAKIQDKANNTVLIKKELNNIDVDIAKEPTIEYNGSNRTPVLGKYGIYLDENVGVTINFDERDDIINYYSINQGITWNEYTGTIQTNVPFIMAKSVKKNSGLETKREKNCNEILSSETIFAEAYDENLETYTYATNKYIQLDNNLVGDSIKLYLHCPAWNHVYIAFYREDKTTIVDDKKYWHTNNGKEYLTMNVPEGAKYIKITPTAEGKNYNCNLYDIKLNTEPKGDISSLYPYIDSNGVHNDNKYKINYYDTAVKKLYSFDNETWYDYPEEGITLLYGDTVYAKNIDKNNRESDIYTYKNELINIISEEAYDGDNLTYFDCNSTQTYYIYIDSNVQGIDTYVKFTARRYSEWHFTFYDNDGNEVGTWPTVVAPWDEGYQDGNLTIPDGATKLEIQYRGGNGGAGSFYEIQILE